MSLQDRIDSETLERLQDLLDLKHDLSRFRENVVNPSAAFVASCTPFKDGDILQNFLNRSDNNIVSLIIDALIVLDDELHGDAD